MEREREPLPSFVRDTPDLPPAYDVALDRGLSALGLDLDDAARSALDGHVRLLLAWTSAINLTSIRDAETAATAHVLDSLAAVRPMRDRGIDRFLDVGSGGGLPGIPLAVALPATDVLLVESIGKKARFLSTAVEAVGLAGRVGVTSARSEALAADPRHRGRWAAVTARAVASAAELIELAFPLLARGGVLVAWKRGDIGEELAAARRAAAALGGGTVDVEDVTVPGLEGHRLVFATRTGAVPTTYPRDPAARHRRPW